MHASAVCRPWRNTVTWVALMWCLHHRNRLKKIAEAPEQEVSSWGTSRIFFHLLQLGSLPAPPATLTLCHVTVRGMKLQKSSGTAALRRSTDNHEPKLPSCDTRTLNVASCRAAVDVVVCHLSKVWLVLLSIAGGADGCQCCLQGGGRTG